MLVYFLIIKIGMSYSQGENDYCYSYNEQTIWSKVNYSDPRLRRRAQRSLLGIEPRPFPLEVGRLYATLNYTVLPPLAEVERLLY